MVRLARLARSCTSAVARDSVRQHIFEDKRKLSRTVNVMMGEGKRGRGEGEGENEGCKVCLER